MTLLVGRHQTQLGDIYKGQQSYLALSESMDKSWGKGLFKAVG